MAMSSNEQVIFRDYPLWLCLTGVVLLALVFGPLRAGIAEHWWQRLLFGLIGVGLIGFDSLLTVTVDHRRGTLNLHYRSLFRVSTKAFLFSEICFVNVAEDNEDQRNYRVELILWSGQTVPLRNGYSIGKGRKDRLAQRLRSVLRVGSEAPAAGIALRPQSPNLRLRQ
jgi:hypothetical protein